MIRATKPRAYGFVRELDGKWNTLSRRFHGFKYNFGPFRSCCDGTYLITLATKF